MSEEIEKTVKDEILDVYNKISEFSLSSQKYFKKLASINKKEENKEMVAEIITNITKCFLNIFGCGIGGAIFEGAKDAINTFKKNKNEIQKLSDAYDSIVKKHNNYYEKLEVKKSKGFGTEKVYGYDKQSGYYYELKNPKVKIKKLETTEEKLNKIYDKYGISGKTIKGRIERKEISDSVVAYHNNLNHVKANKRLDQHDEQINELEEKNKRQNKELEEFKKRTEQQDKDLEELRKYLEYLKKEKEQQAEQMQMLQATLKELQSRCNISQTQLTSQRTNSVATQTLQKEDKSVQVEVLSDKFKGLEKLELSETNDAKDEQVQTPHATETSNEKVQTQQQKDKKAKIRQFHDLPDRPKNVERLKLPKRNDTIKEEEIKISLKSQSLDSGIAHLRDKNKRFNSADKEIKERTHQNDLASVSMLVN